MIPNPIDFNRNREEILKVKTINNEVILFTKNDEELELFSNGVTKEIKDKIQERVNHQLKQIEVSLMGYLDDKFTNITESIALKTSNRLIEEEVNKRINIKLEKIKKEL